jgi:hypothetical protein
MAVTPDQPAPYAPATVILDLIERYRNRGLPSPIDSSVLVRAGVSDSLINRTLQALSTLDLVDADGKPSQALEGMRLAPEAEYRKRMGEWLCNAYADALQFIDPAMSDETAVRDAFRNYKPVGQQDRMVSLFSGLFRAAGIAPEKPTTAAPRRLSTGAIILPRPQKAAITPNRSPVRKLKFLTPNPPLPAGSSGTHPAIAGVLASLPDPRIGWTRDDRDRFLIAFSAVLDFAVPVVERTAALPDDEDDDDAA